MRLSANVMRVNIGNSAQIDEARSLALRQPDRVPRTMARFPCLAQFPGLYCERDRRAHDGALPLHHREAFQQHPHWRRIPSVGGHPNRFRIWRGMVSHRFASWNLRILAYAKVLATHNPLSTGKVLCTGRGDRWDTGTTTRERLLRCEKPDRTVSLGLARRYS